jgi:hypothetical protein
MGCVRRQLCRTWDVGEEAAPEVEEAVSEVDGEAG